MIEEIREKFKKKRRDKFLELPLISENRSISQGLINSQNTLKLCRVGTHKNKFINFDLKTPNEQSIPSSSSLSFKIPLLEYKQNRFGYLRNQTHKNQHSLLVSRMLRENSLPSLGDYDTSNYQKIKYPQSRNFSISNFSRESKMILRQTNQ